MENGAVIACDDGIVEKLDPSHATIAACLLWHENRVKGSGFLRVRVDGLDATGQLAFIVKSLSSRMPGVTAILLDSLTIGGFNLVSPAGLSETTGLPVIVLYKRMPRTDRIIGAVMKHFPDYKLRLRVLRLLDNITVLHTRRGPLYSILWRLTPETALSIVESVQVWSRMPEPLRAAHYYASEISRILIRG